MMLIPPTSNETPAMHASITGAWTWTCRLRCYWITDHEIVVSVDADKVAAQRPPLMAAGRRVRPSDLP
jgi:hypothetical protein